MIRKLPNKVLLVAVLFLAVWLQFPGRADAWSAAGHRIVANIAYDRLDPATRANVVKILRQHDDFAARFAAHMPDDIRDGLPEEQDRWIFLHASIWPDLIRSAPQYHHGTWHYIDLPFYLSELDRTALESVIKPNISMDVPIPLTDAARDGMNCVQAVKMALAALKDAATTNEQKAICYCWLMHIAGDSHQPLHSVGLISRGRFNTSDGDKGGNGIKIKQGQNLHGFWDGLLGGNQSLNEIRKRTAEIVGTDEFKSAGEKAAGQLAPETWIEESHHLVRTVVYHKIILDGVAAGEADSTQPLQRVDLPLEYRQEAGHIAQRRVAEAGYRLAELLKQVGATPEVK